MAANRPGTLVVKGLTRSFEVHLPQGYDPAKKWPIMLNFHAMLGNADVQTRQSGMNAVADKEGFIVVYPEGTGNIPRRFTWNAGTCCGYAVQHNIDDVGFVRSLLDHLQVTYAADSSRIYATGISNGGMLCYRLACELPGRFAAIAPVAADLGVDGPKPSMPIPIIHFHGLKDTFKPFEGGTGKFLGLKHRSIRETIQWWAAVNSCDLTPTEVAKTADYVLERYRPAEGKSGATIDLYILSEGGHTWPGGEDVSARMGTGKLITTVNASQLIWDFCEKHTLQIVAPK